MGSLISKQKQTKYRGNKLVKNHDKKDNKFEKPVLSQSFLELSNTVGAHNRISKQTSLQNLPIETNYRRVRAIHNFEGIQNDDLTFKEGDILDIIDDRSIWWLAENIKSLKRGYIPSSFVIDLNNQIETKDWWFNVNQREAENLLILAANRVGSYLVRPSKISTLFALSVKKDKSSNVRDSISHYRIEFKDGYYSIKSNVKKFNSIQELLDFYSEKSELCVLLEKPCNRPVAVIPFKELEISRKDIQLLEKLGTGQFGEVYKAIFNKKTEVAVKMRKGAWNETGMTADEFIMEAKMMHKLTHPKLVQLMGVCTKEEPIYIITEFMSRGSLLDYLRKCGKDGLPESLLIDMSAQIADGMVYLETQTPPFVHRDLRAANVLVSDFNIVKVADFGLAREGIYNAKENCKFPVKWTAPEAMELLQFTIKSDVWSYGVLLYEIFTYGRVPYPGYDNSIILKELLKGYRMPQPATANGDCPKEIYDLMLRCWELDPDDRPSFIEIAYFYNQINYINNENI